VSTAPKDDDDLTIPVPSISAETLRKVEGLTDQEKEKQKSKVQVTCDREGRKVVIFDEVRDMKVQRWYDDVTVEEVPENGMWTVKLDGRLLVTRTGRGLFLPSSEVATMIAAEWDVQTDHISHARMPLMLLACKAIDDVERFRAPNHMEIMEFLSSDHICYRDIQGAISQRQSVEWDPITQWFVETTGLKLDVTKGFIQNHSIRTLDTIEAVLHTLSGEAFMYLFCLTHSCKSFVLAIAIWHGFIEPEAAWGCMRLEENLQADKFGFIEGAHDYHGTLSLVDILAPSLLLRSCEATLPSKESIKLLGDPTDFLHCKAREDYLLEVRVLQEQIVEVEQTAKAEEEEDQSKKEQYDFIRKAAQLRLTRLEEEWKARDEYFKQRKVERDQEEGISTSSVHE